MSSSENEVGSSSAGTSTYLDEVPFKISQKFQIVALEELRWSSAQSVPCVPECTETTAHAQYDFMLEKKVLEWVQNRFLKEAPRIVPSCPPFWLAFPDVEGEDERNNELHPFKSQMEHLILSTRRCRSFSVTDIRHVCSKVVYKSDSESDDGYAEDDELSSSDEGESQKLPSIPFLRNKSHAQSRFLDSRPASSPDNPYRSRQNEKCFSTSFTRLPHIAGLRRSPLATNTDGEEPCRRHPLTWSPVSAPRKLPTKLSLQHPNNRNGKNNFGQFVIGSPPLSPAQYHVDRSPLNRTRTPVRKYNPPFQPRSANSCLPAPLTAPRPLSSRKPLLDSTADLLSQREQDLIQPLLRQGYPISRVIWAIQNIGQGSTQQILKYLRTQDRLCMEGYKERLVEEAMEIFQNSEEKAKEFLTLMTQFDEMGFHHEDIKEVLLIHNNHRERAFEELVARSR
ncbi:ubiquitin-associated protein 1-like [Amblyraja radiata]|uniref:ubiquitin-associated protein 1-like n=1 Tax=Amblyraja radiata TaxID=386614 RepID=UPI001403A960|nr:ubiquitin-associated protein 1-like [Amblyraja radiata]